MTIINESTVVVFSSDELKKVLEENNNYSYIYFGANLTLLNGITISNTKTNIIIDGTYNGITYQFEDRKSASASDTINVLSTMQKIAVQNMNIIGYNYYGIIYVKENTSYKNVIVEYNNITYIGPQISYHPSGLTRFISSNITIQTNYAAGNEVSECNKIEIGGLTTIIHKSTGNSSFWFRGDNPYLKILTDAVVNFTSEARELFYGVNNLEFTISKNAFFNVTTYNGMGYNNFGTGTTVLEPNSTFMLKQTNRNGGYATWYSYGSITLEKGATLEIINNYNNITSSNYNIYFSSSNAGFYLNEPAKVVLFNNVANVIYSTTSIPFSFKFTRFNLFEQLIGIEDKITETTLPTYSWYENHISVINGTFTANNVVINEHNYTEEELNNLPSLTNFIFPNKKIISVGDFVFRVDALTDHDTNITGTTLPNASILISYNSINSVIDVNDTGEFNYSYEQPLPIGTNITLTTKDGLLYHTKKIQIVYSGEIIIESASKLITFKYEPIKTEPILCPRESELQIVITDSRVTSSNFKLYAIVENELETSTGIVLKNSLVYVSPTKEIKVLSKTPTLVYEGLSNDGNTKTTIVTWNEDEGILLQINSPLINNLEYTTNITWILEE